MTVSLIVLFLFIRNNNTFGIGLEVSDWEYKIVGKNPALPNQDVTWQKLDIQEGLIAPFGYTGFIYYKAKIKKSHTNYEPFREPLGIYLDKVFDVDEVYINGLLIGKTGDFPPYFKPQLDIFRLYLIPPLLWKDNDSLDLYIKVYVGYGFRQGIDITKVSLDTFRRLQRTVYFKTLLWSIIRIGIALLCLLLAINSLPWLRFKKYQKRQIIIFLLALSSCIFALCFSRFQFHLFSVLVSYKIHTISALSMAVCILTYMLSLADSLSKKTLLYVVAIPLVVTCLLLSANDILIARQVNRIWLYGSTAYPFIGIIIMLMNPNSYKKNIACFIGFIIFALCGIHDSADSFLNLNA